jgi:hypothetical protein
MEEYPSTAIFKDEMEGVEGMINDGIYRLVIAGEL